MTAIPNSPPLSGVAFRGALWLISFSWLQIVLRFFVLAILARLLTPQDFGIVSIALIVVAFSEIFGHLGVGPAIVQRPELKPTHVQTAFAFTALFSVGLALLVWFAAPYLAAFFRASELIAVLKVMAFVFPLKAFSVVSGNLLQRELRFRAIAGVEFASYVFGHGVVGVGLALAGFSYWALVGASLAQAAMLSALFSLLASHSFRPRFDRAAFRELIYFGGGFTLAKLFNFAALKGDNVIVGRWLGSASLGIYGRAYTLMTMTSSIMGNVLERILFPSFARLQSNQHAVARAYERAASSIALLVLPFSAFCIALAPEIIHVLLGSQWNEVVVPFQILAAGMIFRIGYKVAGTLARGTGAVYRHAWRQVVYAAAVVSFALLGQRWGVAGVAAGVLAAVALNFFLLGDLAVRLVGMRWAGFGRLHVVGLRLALIVGVIAYGVAELCRGVGMPESAVLGAASLVVTMGLAFASHARPRMVLGVDGIWLVTRLMSSLPLDSHRWAGNLRATIHTRMTNSPW